MFPMQCVSTLHHTEGPKGQQGCYSLAPTRSQEPPAKKIDAQESVRHGLLSYQKFVRNAKCIQPPFAEINPCISQKEFKVKIAVGFVRGL